MRLSCVGEIFVVVGVCSCGRGLGLVSATNIILYRNCEATDSVMSAIGAVLRMRMFRTVSVPLSDSVRSIVRGLSIFVRGGDCFGGVVLVMSAKSLRNLKRVVSNSVGLKVVGGISAVLTLRVNRGVLTKRGVQSVLRAMYERGRYECDVVDHAGERGTVMFTDSTKEGVTRGLAQLFGSDLPGPVPLRVVTCSCSTLFGGNDGSIVFRGCSMLLLIGALDLEVPNIGSIALRRVVGFGGVGMISRILSCCLRRKRVRCFGRGLLGGFSLRSILRGLAVLGTRGLLSCMDSTAALLRRVLGEEFLDGAIVKVGVRVYFLVRHLIAGAPVRGCRGLSTFRTRRRRFVGVMGRDFRALMDRCGMRLPIDRVTCLRRCVGGSMGIRKGRGRF